MTDSEYLASVGTGRGRKFTDFGPKIKATTDLEFLMQRCGVGDAVPTISSAVDVTDATSNERITSPVEEVTKAGGDIKVALQAALSKMQDLTQNVTQLQARLADSEARNAELAEQVEQALQMKNARERLRIKNDARERELSSYVSNTPAKVPQSPPQKAVGSARAKPESPL